MVDLHHTICCYKLIYHHQFEKLKIKDRPEEFYLMGHNAI
jgi:hypothetical protein